MFKLPEPDHTFTDPNRPVSVTCPMCREESVHPVDVKEGYCGHCHAFTTDPHEASARAQGYIDDPGEVTLMRHLYALRVAQEAGVSDTVSLGPLDAFALITAVQTAMLATNITTTTKASMSAAALVLAELFPPVYGDDIATRWPEPGRHHDRLVLLPATVEAGWPLPTYGNGEVVKTALCPRCGTPPGAVLGDGAQAFCFAADCGVVVWRPKETAQEQLANESKINLVGPSMVTGHAEPEQTPPADEPGVGSV